MKKIVLTIAMLAATTAHATGKHPTAIAHAAANASARTDVKQSTSYHEVKQDIKDTYNDYTPPAYAPSIDPTAPCYVPVSAGVGIPGMAVSGGTAYLDQDCRDGEIIRMGLTSNIPVLQNKAAQALNAQLDAALARQRAKLDEAAQVRVQEEGIFALTNY